MKPRLPYNLKIEKRVPGLPAARLKSRKKPEWT